MMMFAIYAFAGSIVLNGLVAVWFLGTEYLSRNDDEDL